MNIWSEKKWSQTYALETVFNVLNDSWNKRLAIPVGHIILDLINK
jgi:hypothetical protein